MQGWIKNSKKSLKEKSKGFQELKLIAVRSSFEGKNLKKHQPIPKNKQRKPTRKDSLLSQSFKTNMTFSKRMVDL